MKHQFTPGPWRIAFGSEITTSPLGIVEGSKHIADCRNPLKTEIENAANARLISASPELLAALESLQDCVAARSVVEGDLPWTSDVIAAMESARDAISKAVAE